MDPSRTSNPLVAGLRMRAAGVAGILGLVARFVRWIIAVARHSGIAGIFVIVGILALPVATAFVFFGSEQNRSPAVAVAALATATFVAGAVWRKRKIRAAQQRRRTQSNNETLAEMKRPENTAWMNALAQRQRAGTTGAGTIPDSVDRPLPPPTL